MLKKILFAVSMVTASNSYAINSIDYLDFDSQTDFEKFAQDLTAVLDHRSLTPANPLGVTGFDVGLGISHTTMSNSSLANVDLDYKTAALSAAANGQSAPVDSMQMLNVQIHKGLPFGIDVGAAYALSASDAPISTFAYEISYAVLSGGVALPAVNVKYTNTTMADNAQLGYKSSAFEVGVSKGLAIFTPYASLAKVSSTVTPKGTNTNAFGIGTSSVTLSTVSSSLTKTSLGVNINLVAFDLLIDMTKLGDITTYSLKTGFRF